jgi:heme a synthase
MEPMSNEHGARGVPRRRVSTATLAWTTLWANVVVIIQGAFVRATGSGAGCGSHWPTCHGEIVPLSGDVHTAIEFTHRLLSLVVLVLGAILAAPGVARARPEPRRLRVRRGGVRVPADRGTARSLDRAVGLTGDNQSTARGLMVATHLVNSLFLVGTLAGTVVYARPEQRRAYPLRLARQGPLLSVLLVALVGMQVLMFSGGIAAMGNTMFPSESLAEGLAADFDPESHPLIRLRILHPLIAIAVGVYLFVALGLARWLKPRPAVRLRSWLLGTYLVQLWSGRDQPGAARADRPADCCTWGWRCRPSVCSSALSVVMLGAPCSGAQPRAEPGPRYLGACLTWGPPSHSAAPPGATT